ncbi:VCBS domain-containing protein, partial [Planktotalea sp.]|uniref:VCBS domain-containing protein n=1 Tax=Planktotalea sp. TaxID=2029877 RepID=UPI003297604A
MPSSTEFDTSNLYLWAQRVTVTDANGFPIEETLTFDDGTIRNTTFSEGLRTGSTWSDPGDIQTWASISVAFDGVTGLPSSKTWTLDNGPTITVTFVDGVQTSYTRTDVSDIYDWSSVLRTYGSSGEITSKVITDDNGKVSTTSYVNGIKTELIVSDGGGAYAWASKTYDYDAAGQLLTTTTLFDDGTSQIVVPAGGPAAQSVTRLDTSNLYSWASFVKTYDAGGLLEEKVWTFDDEVIKTSTFSAGVKVQDDWVDTLDARDWASVTFTYDAAGRIASKNVTNDDGRHVVTSFTDGVRTAQVITDTNNAYGWSSQSRSYDSASRVESLVTNFDDGTISTKSYVAGVLQDEVITDPLGAHAWTTIHHVHSATNGTLLYTHTVLDDGSETYVDERGLPIATGGTTASVIEDSAASLQTSGTIALVDDYRGADDFTAITSVAGDNGYGLFTLLANGTWTYAADNAQAAIQTLEAGDTLTDSFTAITTDGVETTVTVTINGAVGNDAPVFIGAEPVLLAQAGNRVTAGGS